jgi:lysophospholipase L1-like esterase
VTPEAALGSPQRPLRIMPLGDSNTLGMGNPDLSRDPEILVGYRQKLKELLMADGVHSDFVGGLKTGYAVMDDAEHEGWAGQGIAMLQERVRQGVLELYQPDVALLLIGSNDLWRSLEDRRPVDDRRAQALVVALGKLVDEMLRRRPELFLVVGQPCTPADAPRPLEIYRRGIAQVVAERRAKGAGLALVDTLGAEHDGVHFTPAGHEELARRWHRAIMEWLKARRPRPPVPLR